MFFASDNCGPTHPKIMARILADNQGHAMPYGNDPLSQEVTAAVRTLFEAPDAAVYLVATGTAANALALACYTQPYQTVFCTPMAHIEEDECGAPNFYAGGAKMTLVPGTDKMTPDALARSVADTAQGVVHGVQRGPVSITQITEHGGVYTLEQLRALSAVARDAGLPVHMDGARFANAAAALGVSPAEMSWRAGIDVVCFGGTKNGCPGVEAVVFFDPEKAWEFELRRKRGGHLFSKHRHLASQMAAYVEDDLWREMATSANARAAQLAEGLRARGIGSHDPVHANLMFVDMPRSLHRHLRAEGAQYYVSGNLEEGPDDAPLTARFVCDWSLPAPEVDRFLALI